MEESSPNLCEITDINDPRFDPFRRSDVPLSDSLEKIKVSSSNQHIYFHYLLKVNNLICKKNRHIFYW